MSLTDLPSDVLILALQDLSASGLAAVSLSCKSIHSLVEEFGWNGHLRSNPRPALSVAKAQALWAPRRRARYNTLSDRAWSRADFTARPLSRPWTGKFQPAMAISLSRLVVAAGSTLYSYKFAVASSSELESPSVVFEGSVRLAEVPSAVYDITCLTFIDDGGLDQTLCAGYHGGEAERVILIPPDEAKNMPLAVVRFPLSHQRQSDSEFLESLKYVNDRLLSLSSTGVATLSTVPASPNDEVTSSSIDIKQRSWTSHLSLASSSPFAAFGAASTTPLTVYSIQPDRISPTPFANLCMTRRHINGPAFSSAVYGISRAPPCSVWGASDNVLVSGWYDGQVRIYDLRADERPAISESSTTTLAPVLSVLDPWSYEPIYDVACGGGSGTHLAAGSARHSVVSFWDVRSPQCGWSVYAPGNDSSPVYSVILEGSRLFGATQSRPFVYDFGPDVKNDTYPSLPDAPGADGLKGKKGAGYQVVKYKHNRGLPNGY
ncbi:hypothetical protein BDN71DRAFT_1442493 [Pleurotus eryngii]|uniref:F-box domain-containing protein n=1 Tax=Pleurotus eryngii TaxID=5323 RepID=A0A9P6DBV5_PLEER|nr:hypothetical protein BDN71DRAFT_1442493 [Pleurotus eryngii]